MSLWEKIREQMLRFPQKTIKEGNASMTYEELVIFAEYCASGFPKVPYMGVFCESEMATAIGILACFAAGIPAIPLPVRYGKEPCLKIIERADIPVIFTDHSAPYKLVSLPAKKRISVPKEVAAILFTSGSTGQPKGAMLTSENFLANIESIRAYFPIGNQDKVLIARSLYHSSALTSDLLVSLYSGADIIFASGHFQPLQILKLFRDEHITAFGSTPTLLSTLAVFANRFQNDVRLLSVSGECITEGAAKKIRNGFSKAEIYSGYGLTEASPRVAYLPPEWFDICPTATGLPIPNVQYMIVDEFGGEVHTPGLAGELIVRGRNVMLGYFDDPVLTNSKLKNGWLCTGDLAKVDEAGRLYVIGRKDGLIIRGGMNIYPAEIENTLSQSPLIDDVLAYGYLEDNTQKIGLQVCGRFESEAEVATLCKQLLPLYQQPSKIELLDHLERGATGKKKRRE